LRSRAGWRVIVSVSAPPLPACLLPILLTGACAGDDGAAGAQPSSRSARCTDERVVEQFEYSEGEPPTPENFFLRIQTRRMGDRETIRVTYLRGPDDRWMTEDDQIHGHSRTLRSGGLLEFFSFDGPGADGRWLTDDDQPSGHNHWCEPPGPGGRTPGSLQLSGLGPDGKPCTADDEIIRATAYQYDARGTISRTIQVEGAGDDGRWFTDDDEIAGWGTVEYESDGAPRLVRLTRGPGPDGVWLTSDDDLQVYSTFTYKGNDESDQRIGDGGIYRYCVRPEF